MTDIVTAGLEPPLWVADSNAPGWLAFMNTPGYRRLCDWADAEGIDTYATYRVEVYLLDALFAKIFKYVISDDGHLVSDECRDDIARTERFVILSSMPPTVETEAS